MQTFRVATARDRCIVRQGYVRSVPRAKKIFHQLEKSRTHRRYRHVPGVTRRTAAVTRADAKPETPLNVLEAREWIAAWKFKQTKITSLADAINKAASFLEENKETRQALRAAQSRTVGVQFSVKQKVQYGQSVRLVGGTPEFGSWDPKAAPATKWSDGDVWDVTVPLLPGKHEFKIVGLWDKSGEAQWEEGDNRVVEVPRTGQLGVQHFDGRLPKATKPAAKAAA